MNLFTTTGRVPRSVYWGVSAVFFLIAFLGGLITGKGGADKPFGAPEIIFSVIYLLALPVGIIVQIKRWHDLDKSGWWVLINFIPFIGGLWALVECGFLKGTTGPNRFGPDPLDESAGS